MQFTRESLHGGPLKGQRLKKMTTFNEWTCPYCHKEGELENALYFCVLPIQEVNTI